MTTTIVTVESKLSGIEVAEVLDIVNRFIKENRADVKRIQGTFPRSVTGVIEMALDCGLDRLLEVCDFEEACMEARDNEDDR